MTRPLLPPRAECKECANPIVFARLDTGKLIPLDPMPTGRGNVAVMKIGNQLHGYVISAAHPFQDARYQRAMPHAATCPDRKGPEKAKPEPDPSLF